MPKPSLTVLRLQKLIPFSAEPGLVQIDQHVFETRLLQVMIVDLDRSSLLIFEPQVTLGLGPSLLFCLRHLR